MMMDQMRDGLGRTPVECTANERNGETPKNGGGGWGKKVTLGFGTSTPDATGTRTRASGMDGRGAPTDVGGMTTSDNLGG